MTTKTIYLKIALALCISISIIISYATANAMMMGNNKKGASVSAGGSIVEKNDKPSYAPGEVIVKVKENKSIQLLSTQSYTERSTQNMSILSRLKSTYKLREERPVFQDLHKQLKTRNLSLQQLQAKKGAKLATHAQGNKTKLRTETIDLFSIYVLKTDQDVPSLCEKLKKDADIEYAEPNYIRKIQMIPSDPYYSSCGSWGQDYSDLWGIKKIDCEQAWDISQGEGVIVAVIDTGVDYNHEDLQGNIWINESEIPNNGIDDDDNGLVDDVKGWNFAYNDNDPMDGLGHGTHVAGTIAAVGNNNLGVIGVAPKAKIMAVKGLDDNGEGSDVTLAGCVTYAVDNGAQILNNSWGGEGNSQVLKDAFHYAYSKGRACIAAAGNSNDDTSYFSPANIDTVIAVAASNQNDERCDFSNYGAKIDVSAPGGDSPEGDDDNFLFRNILSLRSANNGYPTDMYGDGIGTVGEKYYRSRGTSMACPHVAGVAAIILSGNSNLTNDEVRAMLQMSSDDIGESGKDDYFGYGRVNANRACNIGSISVFITSPLSNGYIHGAVDILGDAFMEEGFQGYELYYAPKNNSQNITLIKSSSSTVSKGLLGEWDTTSCSDGEYILTIKVVNNEGRYIVRPIEITIDNISQPPIFINLTNKGIVLGRPLEFQVEAQDPDEPDTPWGHLVYSADKLPPDARFDPNTRIFYWQPSEQNKGTYEVVFTVRDDEHVVTQKVIIMTATVEITANIARKRYAPVIYDNIIAYESRGCIYAYDLYTGEEKRISSGQYDMSGYYGGSYKPAIDKDKIVWIAPSNGSWNVYMYDISKSWERHITDDPNPTRRTHVDIYGDKIVWQDKRNGNDDIYMYDLSTNQESRITTHVSDQMFPDIDNDKIIWIDDVNINTDIYMHNLSTRIESGIVNKGGIPHIYNDKIVYSAYRNRRRDTYIYDLPSGQETRIDDDNSMLSIYDGRIAEQKDANIYMYDISAGVKIQITTDGSWFGLLSYQWPSIYRDKIVWECFNRKESCTFIYMASVICSPVINSVTPKAALPASLITVKGHNFGYDQQEDSQVRFDKGAVAIVKTWSDSEITCIVPNDAKTGLLEVVTSAGKSNGVKVIVKGKKPKLHRIF